MTNAATARDINSQVLLERASQVQRGGARAAVLGVNDGLVGTLCLVLGVTAAGAGQQAVLLAGFAGMIAGAVSMAVGEWISVKAQVELFEGVLSDLKKMVVGDKELLEAHLAQAFIANGISSSSSIHVAKEIAANDDNLFKVYAPQVIGINPKELGSPWVAAISSLIMYTCGAIAPLSPWFFTGGTKAIWLSVIFTVFGSLFAGGYVANSSGKSILYGSIRQLFIIVLAASVTYGVGFIFGTIVG